jgi:hypothetical protein
VQQVKNELLEEAVAELVGEVRAWQLRRADQVPHGRD